jgi:hypothetical protein
MIAFILSSKQIADELTIDFGDISPSYLPLANDYLLNFQIKELKRLCTDIYISKRKIDKPFINEPDVKDFIIKDNLSLIDLIFNILNTFKGDDIIFLYGDTLIKYPAFIPTNKSILFSTDEVKIPYPNWHVLPDDSIMCGSFFIKKELSPIILEKKIKNVNSLIEILVKNSEILKLGKGKWFDFGNFHTYYNSKKDFLETRSFNKIKVTSKEFIEKSSRDISKMVYEYNWLKSSQKLFPGLTPRVRNLNIKEFGIASYQIEYFNMPSLSDVFVKGDHKRSIKLKIIKNLIKTIDFIQNNSLKKVNKNNFIIDKLESRETEILNFSKELSDKFEITRLINKNKLFFENKNFVETIMHGDYCFSNILYDRRTESLKLIDPRGYLNKTEGYSFYGPYVYDYFKLGHSFIGGYDNIISGKSADSISIQEIKENLIFFTNETSLPKDLLIHGMVNLFLTMVPLHKNNSFRQKNFFKISLILDSLL